MHNKNMSPIEIERDSFKVIEWLVNKECVLSKKNFLAEDWHIVSRMIHASGDVDIANFARINVGDSVNVGDNKVYRDVTSLGVDLLKRGTPIICDVNMVKVGLSRSVKNFSDVHCFIADEDVAKEAEELGETRARRAIFKAVHAYPDGIYLIGNAPTALLALMELIDAGRANPSLIIGVPVGFIMAAESKDMLVDRCKDRAYVTSIGYKGGTPMTVAAMNAIALKAAAL